MKSILRLGWKYLETWLKTTGYWLKIPFQIFLSFINKTRNKKIKGIRFWKTHGKLDYNKSMIKIASIKSQLLRIRFDMCRFLFPSNRYTIFEETLMSLFCCHLCLSNYLGKSRVDLSPGKISHSDLSQLLFTTIGYHKGVKANACFLFVVK